MVDCSNLSINAKPSIISLSPTLAIAGSNITINGTNFTTGIAVLFDGIPATQVVIKSRSTLVVKIPALPPKAVKVEIRTPNGDVSNPAQFTVEFPQFASPAITSLSPVKGIVGEEITIFGANFVNHASVYFGDETSSEVQVENSFTIKAKVSEIEIGATEVRVVNPDYQSSNAIAFEVLPTPPSPPTITGMHPLSGSQGNSITLYGENFTPETIVNFGAMPSDSVTVISTKVLVATVPLRLTSGSVAVTAISAGGAATFSIPFSIHPALPPSSHTLLRINEGELEYYDPDSKEWKPVVKIGDPPPPLDQDGFGVMAILEKMAKEIQFLMAKVADLEARTYQVEGKAINLDLLIALEKAQIDTQNTIVDALNQRNSL